MWSATRNPVPVILDVLSLHRLPAPTPVGRSVRRARHFPLTSTRFVPLLLSARRQRKNRRGKMTGRIGGFGAKECVACRSKLKPIIQFFVTKVSRLGSSPIMPESFYVVWYGCRSLITSSCGKDSHGPFFLQTCATVCSASRDCAGSCCKKSSTV